MGPFGQPVERLYDTHVRLGSDAYTYTEDSAGNITAIHDATDPTYNRDFAYDDLNRLITANSGPSLWGSGSYAYDTMGNLTSRSLGTAPVDDGTVLSVPGRHVRAKKAVTGVVDTLGFTYNATTPEVAVATWNGTDHTVTYDAAGNETSYFATRTYSPRNLLATVTDPSGEGTPHTLSYGYDARGVRVMRSESPTASGTANRYFTYSPELQLLAITDDDSQNVWASRHASITSAPIAPSHNFIYLNGMPVFEWGTPRTPDSTVLSTHRHTPLAVATTVYYTFTDHLGTPLLQTDDSGAMVWRAEHEPYGNVWTMRKGSRTDQPLRLPGQDLAMTWEGTEENYNVFRWYSSGWGRYTQADPISLQSGTNLYLYAVASPAMYVDPSGLYTTDDQTLRSPTQLVNVLAACKTSPVACTLNLGAAISFKCEGCSNQWKPTDVRLHIRGHIYAYSGNPKNLHLHIVDPSVHDFASAAAHEHSWHIDIAARSVRDVITTFEGEVFENEMECEDAGAWANSEVQFRFGYVYHETQSIENRGGDPRAATYP